MKRFDEKLDDEEEFGGGGDIFGGDARNEVVDGRAEEEETP